MRSPRDRLRAWLFRSTDVPSGLLSCWWSGCYPTQVCKSGQHKPGHWALPLDGFGPNVWGCPLYLQHAHNSLAPCLRPHLPHLTPVPQPHNLCNSHHITILSFSWSPDLGLVTQEPLSAGCFIFSRVWCISFIWNQQRITEIGVFGLIYLYRTTPLKFSSSITQFKISIITMCLAKPLVKCLLWLVSLFSTELVHGWLIYSMYSEGGSGDIISHLLVNEYITDSLKALSSILFCLLLMPDKEPYRKESSGRIILKNWYWTQTRATELVVRVDLVISRL